MMPAPCLATTRSSSAPSSTKRGSPLTRSRRTMEATAREASSAQRWPAFVGGHGIERQREDRVHHAHYVLGGPVQSKSFVQLDDAGESEIWCQIFNLLDWPAINIPIRIFQDDAATAQEESHGLVRMGTTPPMRRQTDAFDEDAARNACRTSACSSQPLPEHALALLDYAERISKAHKSRLAIASDTEEAEPT